MRGVADVQRDVFDNPYGGDDALVETAGAVEHDGVTALEVTFDRTADVDLPDRVAVGERLDEVIGGFRSEYRIR